ncbi:MAG TPA: hypothetical protein VIV58_30535 [Kofleriaceae bacterium]
MFEVEGDGAGEEGDDRSGRRELAERWRVLGEKLRARSPRAFTKLLAVLTTSAVGPDDDDDDRIDSVYQIH